LGGHIVSGHVDGLARIVTVTPDAPVSPLSLGGAGNAGPLHCRQRLVALDGVSLTVNEVVGRRFGINVIPHTLTATTLGIKKPGDAMNLEVDVLARYVARALEYRR
jgi:riboflavin synthase